MLKALLSLYARLPLPVIHSLGIIAGWGMYLFDVKFSRRIRNNLRSINIAEDERSYRRLVHTCARETGKGLMETFAIWYRDETTVLKWVRECYGWEHVDEALARGKGIIFLTPHLGSYEITSIYYAVQHPITVLYRPSRQRWLTPLMEQGRSRGKVRLAPTNMGGLRELLRALRKAEAVGILPDQVPESGEGVWTRFFGRPAYTMTLVEKLAETTGATVLMAFGERLPWGRGYHLHIKPLTGLATPQNMNDGIERLVRSRPEQYLWSYRRFKTPPRTSATRPAE
ncbi:MAG TPA: lysophospholipid acyltransferase family protein [Methylophilaceae bacterium]|nr:lysophospholipid acyltransferase family protein [Methylophilaceae bacterium]